MKIALFFGSFNPVHVGHTTLADYILKKEKFDQAWFIVSPANPLKKIEHLADENLRLSMLKLAIAENPHFFASDIEYTLPKPSYTIHTLEVLKEKYPQHEFTLVIGSDNLQLFEKWKDYKKILAETDILVYPRSGYAVSRTEPEYATVRVIEAPVIDVSSTQIRQAIEKGNDISSLVNPAVKEFIEKHNMYKKEKTF